MARKKGKKWYYVYRSALTGNFITRLAYEGSDPATVYREKRRAG